MAAGGYNQGATMYANGSIDAAHGPREAAVAAVHRLRDALCRANAAQVAAARATGPRQPGERDLLADLTDAVGPSEAAKRLSRFWRRAQVLLEHVRVVDDQEIEVYERAHLPDQVLPIVSVVRRNARDEWQVLCTHEAHDERLVVWIPTTVEPLDDGSWTRAFQARFGPHGELVLDGPSGVLGHPSRGWLAELGAPFVPRQWPEGLPGEEGQVRRLTAALAPDGRERHPQLAWVLHATEILLDQLGAPAALLPDHGKLLPSEAVRIANREPISSEHAARLWVAVARSGSWWTTSGMGQLGLPEVELEQGSLPSNEEEKRLVRRVAASIVDGHDTPDATALWEDRDRLWHLVPGRRGPRPGRSYGRWGAVRIQHAPSARRGSGLRWCLPAQTRNA